MVEEKEEDDLLSLSLSFNQLYNALGSIIIRFGMAKQAD
jgi:hypothetical protein